MHSTPHMESGPTRRIRTIVVDDSADFLRSFYNFLETSAELQIVGTGEDGFEAVRLAAALQPDLVILDVEMPGKGGLQAAAELRELFPTLRIIMTSVHDGPGWHLMSRSGCVDAFVPKQRLVQDLPERIQSLFNGQSSEETIR